MPIVERNFLKRNTLGINISLHYLFMQSLSLICRFSPSQKLMHENKKINESFMKPNPRMNVKILHLKCKGFIFCGLVNNNEGM